MLIIEIVTARKFSAIWAGDPFGRRFLGKSASLKKFCCWMSVCVFFPSEIAKSVTRLMNSKSVGSAACLIDS